MNEKIAYALWACLYALCAALGTVTDAAGFGKLLLTLTSLIFFLPAVYLLIRGFRTGTAKAVRRIRWICVGSLSLSLLMIIVNVLSVTASPAAGQVLNTLLLLVSVPMFCAQSWALSLFLWACLLMSTFLKPGKKL